MNSLRLVISKNKLNVWLYSVVLIIPFAINSFEANVVLLSIFLLPLFFKKEFKVTQTLLISSTILLSIFIIAFIVHFYYENQLYDVLKDTVYLIKPFVYLLLGFFIASNIKNKEDVFKVIVFMGILLAVIHFLKLLIYVIEYKNYQISAIRYVGGKDNFLELMACSLLMLNKKKKYFNISFRFKRLTYLILAMSFIFYFSRTMTVAFFIIVLTVNGYAKLTKKAFMAISVLLVVIILFYKVLYSLDIDRGAEGIEGFMYKLKIAPSEIFSSNVNVEDPKERWDHWRAYEAKKAFDTMKATESSIPYFFGMGLGSLVNLGFEADLGSEKMQYIPKIHNGYVYIFFKTGIIGLILYLFLLLNLYLQSYSNPKNDKILFVNNFIAAIALFYFFSSFIISGFYNPKDVFTIILGALLFLQIHYKKIA